MAVIKDLRKIIQNEDLDPNYFKGQAEGIVKEFGKDYIDPAYVVEKIRNLMLIPYIVCREEYGRGSSEVEKCVKELVGMDRFDKG